MAGRTHRVTIRGEVMVQACERRWNNFCRHCEAAEKAQVMGDLPELPPLELFGVWRGVGGDRVVVPLRLHRVCPGAGQVMHNVNGVRYDQKVLGGVGCGDCSG